MSDEIWKVVEDFPEYEVSSKGRVRNTVKRPGTWPGRTLTPTSDRTNPRVRIGSTTRAIYKLVVHAFIGPSPGKGFTVQHIDGNPGNNSLENLRWRPPLPRSRVSQAAYQAAYRAANADRIRVTKAAWRERNREKLRAKRRAYAATLDPMTKREIARTCYHRAKEKKPKVHGSLNSYNYYGCRCTDCVASKQAYTASRKQAANE
jgi:hypothetical protein